MPVLNRAPSTEFHGLRSNDNEDVVPTTSSTPLNSVQVMSMYAFRNNKTRFSFSLSYTSLLDLTSFFFYSFLLLLLFQFFTLHMVVYLLDVITRLTTPFYNAPGPLLPNFHISAISFAL